MKRTSIAVLLLLVVAACAGCNRGKDEVLPNGHWLFGLRTLKDGTKKVARAEYAGTKTFDVIRLTDGTEKAGHVECSEYIGREKHFDIVHLPDGTEKIARVEFPSGKRMFDVTIPRHGPTKIARIELPDGEKQFDITADFFTEKIARDELPDGERRFDVTADLPGLYGLVFTDDRVFPYEPPKPKFTNVQNDQQGYADAKWGTGIADLDPNAVQQSSRCFSSSDPEENEVIAATFAAPTRDTVVAGTVLSTSLDFSTVPAKCKSVTKGGVKLIFYDDKLTMAVTHLNAHNYEAIASEMESKFTEVDGWSVNWGGGAMSDGDSTSLEVQLFKRGETNTRVFLLNRIAHMGIGMDVSSVYLLYIPNVYYQNVKEDMAKAQREQQAQQVAEQQKREQPDLQKIQ